jgi:hypothetical protein
MSDERHDDRRIIELLLDIDRRQILLEHNVGFLTQQVNNANLRLIKIESIISAATGGTIYQIKGGRKMAITGTPVGGKSSFQVTWNGAMAPGTPETWSVDDPNVTLSPETDPTIVDAADSATDTATLYNITVTANNSAGQPVTATAQVPLIPPPPTPATGGTINQIS